MGRDAPHFVSCTSRSCTRFHSEDGRKNALVPPAGGGNLTIVQPVSQLLDSYPNLTDLGEGKYLTPAPSNLLHGGRTMPNSSHPVLPREWGRERGGMRT